MLLETLESDPTWGGVNTPEYAKNLTTEMNKLKEMLNNDKDGHTFLMSDI